MRVPPDQSATVAETRARPMSGSRPASSRVTRVSCVPNTNASTRTLATRPSAMTNRMSRREWRSIDPLMSQMTTMERGRIAGRRQTHSPRSPPVWRLRRSI